MIKPWSMKSSRNTPNPSWNELMLVKLTVDGRTLLFDIDAIGIGRDPDNQVALPDDSRLAPLHAVMRCVNGRWIIESKDGGPIRIGNGRPSRFAWLNPGDVIHLTETGPELLFEPSNVSLSPPGADRTKPPISNAGASATAPYVPFIPDLSTGPVTSKPVTTSTVTTNASANRSTPVASAPNAPDGNSGRPQLPWIAAGIGSVLLVIGIGVGIVNWANGRSRTNDATDNSTASTETGRADHAVEAASLASPDETPVQGSAQSNVSATVPKSSIVVDPQEFLVLVAIGDMKSDDRPHVLGVGWLWDDQTAVTSRVIGEAITQVVAETTREGSPRQGCVIQGLPFEVATVIQPDACPEISILKLKEPAELPQPAQQQWKKTNAAGIERLRARGKSPSYLSYAAFPRPQSVRGNHGFPLCEYDPETCRLQKMTPRLVYQPPQHFLNQDDSTTRIERGGLLIDDDSQIVGMVPLNSHILWTETLEKALRR
jgi:pSer/pThr/pTyr-binding forkhead associated (FHA) protein